MKKRTALAICAIWILTLFVVLTPPVPLVDAYDYGYGHASLIYASQFNQTDADIMRSQWASTDIYNLFAARGIQVYSSVENYYAAICEELVHNETQDSELNHPTTAIFYHGHGGKISITGNPLGLYRYFIYEQAPQEGEYPPPWHRVTLDDYQDIFPYTPLTITDLCFFGHIQGNEVGGYSSGYNRGMPYAWSHRAGMSTNGYVDPDNYIFIGFENMSRSISYWPTPNNTYEQWLVFFYYFATNGYSIHDALDEASTAVWGPNTQFDDTELYNGYWERNPNFDPSQNSTYPTNWEWWWSKMRVYGNGDRTLPY